MKIKIDVDLKVGKVVRYFVLADLLLLAGMGLVQPIFSIYVIGKVAGATLITVGAAASVYWLSKSFLQLPVAKYLDRHEGESDDFRALIIGLFIISFAFLAFILISKPWHLYLAQLINAVGFALYMPSWSAIFSRHLDKDKVSFDWSLDSTAAGLSAGITGVLGGVVANWLGFTTVFILAAVFSAGAAIITLIIPEVVLPRRTTGQPIIKDHTPVNIVH